MSFGEIKELDAKGLREFGLVTGAIVAGLFGLFFPWLLERSWPVWPWVVAGVLAAWALAAPSSLGPVYRVWMRFGMVMGAVMSRVVLGVLFFLVITPLGVIMRAFGHDSMGRKIQPDTNTYRIPSRVRESKHMERPF
jgi:apolipoprotein N-acyltransferase